MSSSIANAQLENMRDVFIDEIFNNEISHIPSVRFGTLHKWKRMQYCVEVYNSVSEDIADEIIIASSITNDRFAVATALLFGLITSYARERQIKISSREDSTYFAHKREYADYCGNYYNERDFKPLADKYGLILKKSPSHGYIPIDVSKDIKLLIEQKRWFFTAIRDKYLYGKPKKTNDGKGKCICPNCKKVSFYETKRQNLYCADCMENIARKKFGSEWDDFLQSYGQQFKIVRAGLTCP